MNAPNLTADQRTALVARVNNSRVATRVLRDATGLMPAHLDCLVEQAPRFIYQTADPSGTAQYYVLMVHETKYRVAD